MWLHISKLFQSIIVSYGILSQPLLLLLLSGYLPIIKDCSELLVVQYAIMKILKILKILEFINVIVGNACLSELPN